MKKLTLGLILCISTTAMADVNYDCSSEEANNVGLPTSIYLEIEGNSVSIQNSKNDLYHTGSLVATINANGDKAAVGFKGLLLSAGSVIISKGVLKGEKSATIKIVDEALDSVETVYACKASE